MLWAVIFVDDAHKTCSHFPVLGLGSGLHRAVTQIIRLQLLLTTHLESVVTLHTECIPLSTATLDDGAGESPSAVAPSPMREIQVGGERDHD